MGLNKVRHVEVDILGIQEQQARKILPLRKIPGPKNPSDLCTKNVPAALVEQYLRQLSVEVVEGRAAVAQQLHGLRRAGGGSPGLSPVIAFPPGGGLLGGVIGGRMISEGRVEQGVNARSPGGALLGEIIGGPDIKEKRKLKANKKTSPEESCVDSWKVSGQRGVWGFCLALTCAL